MSRDATELHTRVLFDVLTKESDIKETDADLGGEQPEDNEDETLVGMNTNQDRMPEDRHESTIDAEWGDTPSRRNGKFGPNNTEHYSDATREGFIQSRQNILTELFDSKKPATETAQKFVGEQLAHGKKGDYETAAPILEKDATLAELTKGILD